MANRLALLPLTGAGERTCDGCKSWGAPWDGNPAFCGVGLVTMKPRKGTRAIDSSTSYARTETCLQAERDAARLRAVEVAARAYFAADDALAEKMQESEHWRDIDAESARAGEALLALRAALTTNNITKGK